MSDFQTIEIDFDVHKKIEAERKGFSDSPNDALRRLLDLGEASKPLSQTSAQTNGGRAWQGKNVSLPHGTEVRMKYNGTQYKGLIDDGQWLVEGERYGSPSAAASGVAITKSGNKTSLDGWIYWEAMKPGESRWTAIKQLRRPITLAYF